MPRDPSRTESHHRFGRADVEQRGLAGGEVALRVGARRHRVVQTLEHLCRVPERRKRPDLRERLQHLPVREPEVDPPAQVAERLERPIGLAGCDDRLDRALADVLDREQAESYPLVLDR